MLATGLCTALLLAGLSIGDAQAGAKAPGMVLYRYVDSRGVKVLDSQGVPAEYAGKGYEVLNQQGRVIQVVAPALTPEQLQQKRDDQAKADADALLVKKYPNLTEVDRARERKMAELDANILVAGNSQQALLLQQQTLQSQAADLERSGKPVPQGMLDELKRIHEQRDGLEQKVRDYQAQRAQADKDFTALKARLAPLLAP
ncbi:DUF4124 domain-containing protein [Pseudomonas sp. dw_358]|uniref:DUF4124 domain-containing protein n=1 Tax=Pseudomonas sp. dw_358 TaxID=2720083 RepID=UPI001BD24D35|nr:DUF4124 domain-containing protein [Pseudomonas sp. dw_358]